MASDFMATFGDWMVDGVTATPTDGISVEGPVAGTAQALGPVLVEDRERMVRNSQGVEVLSSRAVYVPAEAPYKPTLGDVVTFPDGRKGRVLNTHDLAAYGVLDHMVVSCE